MKICQRAFAVLFLALLTLATAVAQTPNNSSINSSQNDANALTIVSRCLQASGLSTASTVADISASGEVHHYWAGSDVQGTATLSAQSPNRFRFDSVVADGKQSWIVSDMGGQVRTIAGRVLDLPLVDFLISKNPVAPFLELAAAANEPSSVIRYIDSVATPYGTADRILLTKTNADAPALDKTSKLYYIDHRTSLVIETDEMLGSTLANQDKFVRRLTYSGFSAFQGITLATQISEFVAGQKTWLLHLTSVSVNSGVSSDLFKF